MPRPKPSAYSQLSNQVYAEVIETNACDCIDCMDLIYNTYLDGERTQTEEGTRNKIKCGLMGVFIFT